jgi:hypothetical protein
VICVELMHPYIANILFRSLAACSIILSGSIDLFRGYFASSTVLLELTHQLKSDFPTFTQLYYSDKKH